MSAELLRRAAKVLRDVADLKRTDPWLHDEDAPMPYLGSVYFDGDPQYAVVANVMWPGAEAYIALMHPPVALALAELLDQHAAVITEWAEAYAGQERAGDLTETDMAALDLARVILREA